MRHNYFKVLLIVSLVTVGIIPNFTFTNTAHAAEYPDSVTFKATIRDFKGIDQDGGHPDFESPAIFKVSGERRYKSTVGLVQDTLGADKKPMFKESLGMITDEDSFDQWYNDVEDVNRSVPYKLVLEHKGNGVYEYSNSEFFPINDEGFKNYTNGKNYHFTTEVHSRFVYHGGEKFTFDGDDDLWLFINTALLRR